MNFDKEFNGLVNDFSKLDGIDAILIGGSKITKTDDKESDYDLYVYLSKEIPVAERKAITDKYCEYMEINNQFWETEDDGILANCKVAIDIIYRGLDWIEEHLNGLLNNYWASTGYTTCVWFNYKNSVILFDKTGRAKALQDKFDVEYPDQLVKNIIAKNYPILRKSMPAYYFQIEKAIKRRDLVSIHHRVTPLLESYFDILYAINKIPHPGEKKMVELLVKDATILPENMEQDLEDLLINLFKKDFDILGHINMIVDRLDKTLQKINLFPEI